MVTSTRSTTAGVPGKERLNRRLTALEKADAREALRLLRPSGMSLVVAARLALGSAQNIEVDQRTTLNEAVSKFLRSVQARNRRQSTIDFYDEQLGYFEADYGGKKLFHEIERRWLKAYFEELLTVYSANSVWCRYRAVRALVGFALRQDPRLIRENPVPEMKTLDIPQPMKGGEKTLPYLTIEACRHLLANINSHYLPALILMLFAGVRPEEVKGDEKPPLLWSMVTFANRTITIPPEIAKTRLGRTIQNLPDAPWLWLERIPKKQRCGPILPRTLNAFRDNVKRHLEKADDKYIQDILRHTFGTYYMAYTNNPGPVALAMGHESGLKLLLRVYAASIAIAPGKEFFALTPSTVLVPKDGDGPANQSADQGACGQTGALTA